jgi:predicted dehydrogenase
MSARETIAVFDAFAKSGTFVGEAYMYRLHPLAQMLGELVASGAIGEIRMIQSSFGFHALRQGPDDRLFAKSLGGGGILDVGGYPVSMARFIAGAAGGKPFLDPIDVNGVARLNDEGVDEWAASVLKFENGIVAQLSCAVSVELDNVLRIHGQKGRIEVPDFWFAGGAAPSGGPGLINIVRPDRSVKVIDMQVTNQIYAFEVNAATQSIEAGLQEFAPPGMTWDDSIGNARVLDQWLACAGVIYS